MTRRDLNICKSHHYHIDDAFINDRYLGLTLISSVNNLQHVFF